MAGRAEAAGSNLYPASFHFISHGGAFVIHLLYPACSHDSFFIPELFLVWLVTLCRGGGDVMAAGY